MHARKIRSSFFWEEAPFLRPALALVAGILLYECMPPSGAGQIALLCITPAVLAGLAVTGLRRDPGPAATFLQRALVPAFFVTLGLLACAGRDPQLQPGFSPLPPAGPASAVISAAPRIFESGQSFPVLILHTATDTGIRRRATGARIVCYNDSSASPRFLAGDTILLTGRWESLRMNGNPFEPDLAAAMRRKGIYFRLQTGASAIRCIGRQADASKGWLRRIHDGCALRLERSIPDRQALGLIQAMLLGDEAGFDPVLRGLYADTGIIHIVSISGSHVAMLFAVIAALLQWIPGERGAWVRYGAGLLLVWLYVLVAGAPPSALRSAVMFSVVALSTLSKREGRGLNTLCSAAFILLLAEPAWIFAPGFQLSFAAVLSLMLFYQPLLRVLHVRARPLRWLWQAVCASIAAEILTAPIVACYFHSFPLMFIPANIIAGVAIGSGGLIGGMLIIGFSFAPPVAQGLGYLIGRMLDGANAGLRVLQDLSPEPLRHIQLSAPGFLLLMLAISLLGIAWLGRRRAALLGALSLIAVLITADLIRAREQLGQHRLIVYNNGRQALIDEISGNRHHALIRGSSDFHAVPARTGLGAWKAAAPIPAPPCVGIGGRRILILGDSLLRKPEGRLRADVIVLTQFARRLRIQEALDCFRPATVVLGARFSDYRRQAWRDSCRARRIAFHDVHTMGAWQAD